MSGAKSLVGQCQTHLSFEEGEVIVEGPFLRSVPMFHLREEVKGTIPPPTKGQQGSNVRRRSQTRNRLDWREK